MTAASDSIVLQLRRMRDTVRQDLRASLGAMAADGTVSAQPDWGPVPAFVEVSMRRLQQPEVQPPAKEWVDKFTPPLLGNVTDWTASTLR